VLTGPGPAGEPTSPWHYGVTQVVLVVVVLREMHLTVELTQFCLLGVLAVCSLNAQAIATRVGNAAVSPARWHAKKRRPPRLFLAEECRAQRTPPLGMARSGRPL
jgi:hypothetical protein